LRKHDRKNEKLKSIFSTTPPSTFIFGRVKMEKLKSGEAEKQKSRETGKAEKQRNRKSKKAEK